MLVLEDALFLNYQWQHVWDLKALANVITCGFPVGIRNTSESSMLQSQVRCTIMVPQTTIMAVFSSITFIRSIERFHVAS